MKPCRICHIKTNTIIHQHQQLFLVGYNPQVVQKSLYFTSTLAAKILYKKSE